MMRRLLALLLVSAALPLWALEGSSADAPQPGAGDQRPAVLRPAYLFNMRGRRDPFININVWQTAGSSICNISALQFKGLIGVDGSRSALFVSSTDRAMFTLRGSKLYGANDKPVPGVSGRILDDHQVRLRQGEMSLNYSATRSPKRKI